MLRFHRNLPALSCPKKTSAPKTQLSPIQPQSQSPHSAPFHTARCIAPRSTQHRLTLHVASPHAPCSVNPPYSKSLFPPRVEGPRTPPVPLVLYVAMPSQPARASRPLPACCPCFPCLLAPSVCFTIVSRLVAPPCFLPFSVRSSAFPSRMLRFHRNLPALSARFPPAVRSSSFPDSFRLPPALPSSSSSPPAWPGGNTEKALRDCSRRASD